MLIKFQFQLSNELSFHFCLSEWVKCNHDYHFLFSVIIILLVTHLTTHSSLIFVIIHRYMII